MKKKQNPILETMLISLVLAFVFACLPISGHAQNAPTVFALVDFMKVKPGNEAKYVDLEKNVWKAMHQERIKKGIITGWVLYKVLYTGSSDPYNYVTVTFFDNSANLEDPWAGIDPKKILPGKDVDKAYDETLNSRDLVKSNLIVRQDEVVPEGGPGDIKYIEVDYMKVKPGNEAAYMDVEKKIWEPIHKEFIKAGTRSGWSLWGQMYPAGSATEYQYITANYFPDFKKIGTADYTDAFKKAHAGEDVDALGEKTDKSRDLVKTELWQTVDVVMKQ
jgi:L-rhamnose mutarotase